MPWLAESYQLADDLSSITFKLRQGIKFHDGSDFNAEVAKWNLDNMIAGKVEPNWASVDVIDSSTIRVNFSKWSNLLLLSFADTSTPAYMVSKAAFDKNGLDYMRNNPIGTGPFKFVSFQLDTAMNFVKNPDYWRADAQGNKLPYLDELEFIYISDPATQKNVIRAGEADMIHLADAKTASNVTDLGLTTKFSITDIRGLAPDSANSDSPWATPKFARQWNMPLTVTASPRLLAMAIYKLPTRRQLATVLLITPILLIFINMTRRNPSSCWMKPATQEILVLKQK